MAFCLRSPAAANTSRAADPPAAWDLYLLADWDAQNNLYIGGAFAGTCDVDPGTGVLNYTANGNRDISITKMAPVSTGVAEQGPSSLSVYPNPGTDRIYIHYAGAGPLPDLELRDLSGRTLMQMSSNNNGSATLDIRPLASGTYLLLDASGALPAELLIKQ